MSQNSATFARRKSISTRDLIVLAVLAGLGGGASVLLSHLGAALRGAIGLPGGLQLLAGLHVLWLVLAALLVPRFGAATATGLLKGGVEWLGGSSHGLLVVIIAAVAGLIIDAVLLHSRGRLREVLAVPAAALAAASNVPVFQLFARMPLHKILSLAMVGFATLAAVSGAVLGGWLALGLVKWLRAASLARPADLGTPRHLVIQAMIAAVTILAVAGVLGWIVIYLGRPAY